MRNGIRHAQCTVAWQMLFDRFEIHVQVADLASRNSRSQLRSENGSGISGGGVVLDCVAPTRIFLASRRYSIIGSGVAKVAHVLEVVRGCSDARLWYGNFLCV